MSPSPRRRRRLDIASLLVIPLGFAVVLFAQVVDGVGLRSLWHASAALIVLGGTLGAVLISYSPREIGRAVTAAGRAFLAVDDDIDALAARLVALSIRAHRRGLPAIEADVEQISDPFLKGGLALVVDNTASETLIEYLTVEKAARDAEDESPARVFEAAAGYAPTLGILGAVLGLIRVMQQLGSPSTLGAGIAVAFVATAYGVASANLVLLPLAGRLRERAAMATRRRDLIVQGVCAIQQRVNPRLVAQKLRAFSTDMPRIEDLAPRMAAAGSLRARMLS